MVSTPPQPIEYHWNRMTTLRAVTLLVARLRR